MPGPGLVSTICRGAGVCMAAFFFFGFAERLGAASISELDCEAGCELVADAGVRIGAGAGLGS